MSWGVFGWTREILHTAPGKATAELKRIDEGPAVGTQREAPLNRGGLLLSIYRSLSAGPAVGLDHEAIRVADDGSYRLPLRSPREADQTFPPPAHLTHATSAFWAMKVLQAVAGVAHRASSDQSHSVDVA